VEAPVLLEELFQANHIALDDFTPGRHYTICPQCSAQRGRAHQTLKCLGITIEADDAAFWGCNHCGWTGPRKGNGASGPGLTAYIYRDIDGEPRFRKVRNLPGRAGPRFWLEQPDGQGGWRKGTKGVDTGTLYRIDEVAMAIAEGGIVCVAEGEKDVDNLWRLGFAATTNAHGASEMGNAPKWTTKHSAQLKGAEIVVFNDNDAPGYEHADTTCRLSIGIAARVRRLDLKDHWPDIPKGADISDWLAQGHGREELAALIDAALPYEGPPPGPEPPPRKGWRGLCILNDKGQIVPNLANVMTALRADPSLGSVLAFDEMEQTAILAKPMPIAPNGKHAGTDPVPRLVRDEDVSQLQEWLQHQGLPRIGKDTIHQAADQRARECSFHPVRDWLESLKWDETKRLTGWLQTYLPQRHRADVLGLDGGARLPAGMQGRLHAGVRRRAGHREIEGVRDPGGPVVLRRLARYSRQRRSTAPARKMADRNRRACRLHPRRKRGP
jgi:hypothetical protein